MKRPIIAATMLLLAVAHPAVAAAPPVISYQGVLTEVNGQLVPDGPHIFTFSVWDAAQNGNMLYCESQALAIVKGGVSALVGSGTLCANPPNPSLQSLTFDVPYWLQVAVDADPALERVPLTSSPYAFIAKTVPNNTISSSKVLDGSLIGADIADNSIAGVDILDNSIAGADILDNSISAADIGPNILSSIDGVSNDGGNLDLVAGPGIALTPDDVSNTITIRSAPPAYFVSSFLNTVSFNATTTWTKIDDYLTFTKASPTSPVEAYFNSRIFSGTFGGGAIGVRFAIRIDDLESGLSSEGAITASGATQFTSMFSAFTGLAAGPHTVSIWARTSLGTSTGVLLDSGGWGGRIVVKEAP